MRALSIALTVIVATAASRPPRAAVTEAMVVEATVDQLQAWMKSGQLTSRRLTEIYLARIDRYDRHGPRINSLLEINPQALVIADSLDRERRTKGPRGPLHGIPVILKDAIATADQLRTSNGGTSLDRLESPTRGQRNSPSGSVEVSMPVKAGSTYLVVVGSDAGGVKGGRYVLNWRLDAPR